MKAFKTLEDLKSAIKTNTLLDEDEKESCKSFDNKINMFEASKIRKSLTNIFKI